MSPRILMGEYDKHATHPDLYERFAPEYRFARIANAILEKIGESPVEAPMTKVAVWPNDPKGHNYKLQAAQVRSAWGQITIIYNLEHFIDGLPAKRPLDRYTVSTSGGSMSRIGIFDGDNKPKELNPVDRNNSIKQLISILHDAAPKESRDLLDELFKSRYENLIGSFVLSDLALESNTNEISELAAWEAIEEHIERVEAIKEKALEKSRRHDSPAKQESIEEAVMTSRTRTNKNSYEPVDITAATERIAREIGKKWKNTVSPEQ